MDVNKFITHHFPEDEENPDCVEKQKEEFFSSLHLDLWVENAANYLILLLMVGACLEVAGAFLMQTNENPSLLIIGFVCAMIAIVSFVMLIFVKTKEIEKENKICQEN